LATNLADRQAAIDAQFANLAAFVGDGKAWRFELAESAAKMDDALTSEASCMQDLLFTTVEEFLGFVNHNIRQNVSPEIMAKAASAHGRVSVCRHR
jgi:hypothetical protein